jgi:hypothetical protein
MKTAFISSAIYLVSSMFLGVGSLSFWSAKPLATTEQPRITEENVLSFAQSNEPSTL